MKRLALDIGDVWTGVAISDELGMFARPYKTVKATELISFLRQLLQDEPIGTIVIGYPQTIGGQESEQTRKTLRIKQTLEKEFPGYNFALWDERYTSQQAQELKKVRSKEDKLKIHAIAAAFILDTYLAHERAKSKI